MRRNSGARWLIWSDLGEHRRSCRYYQIIEAEADVVRMVYDRNTEERLNIGAITRLLNEQGVPTHTDLQMGTVDGLGHVA
jgi:hypothetical protein